MTSLFGHSIRSDLLVLYVSEALACFVAVYAVLAWRAGIPAEQSHIIALAAALICGVISGATGLYRTETLSRLRRIVTATLVAGVLFTASLPAFAMMKAGTPDLLQGQLLTIPLAFAGAIISTRLGYAAMARRGYLRRRLLVVRQPVGPSLELDSLTAEGRQRQFEIASTLAAGPGLEQSLDVARLREMRIWAVVTEGARTLPAPLRARIESGGVRVVSESELRERELARVDIEALPAGWLAASRAARESLAERSLRRVLDILCCVILVVFTSPLLVGAAIAIKLDSRGPVLYRQERVGRGNKTFMLLKFRSMRADAEEAGRPVWASKADPRITRVGRWLRLTRIDEIPQVFNVLRGDMHFVGPRPERPGFVEQLGRQIPHYHDRAAVKPGITGWAQVNYPYGASVEDARMKLAYDLYYVRRRSLFLDVLILISTVRVILFQEGAR
jgi:exopolysaccharide biosynthesis polyprenyl glycosylphosphotransferase